MIGDPPNARIVRPVEDEIPVTFPYPPCLYASWVTPELMRELEEETRWRPDRDE